jgi:hypothetical protein
MALARQDRTFATWLAAVGVGAVGLVGVASLGDANTSSPSVSDRSGGVLEECTRTDANGRVLRGVVWPSEDGSGELCLQSPPIAGVLSDEEPG